MVRHFSILQKSPPILAILGPTAVGKTALAIEVAKKLNGEVIGLDSRQMYAGMEIGTAQPTWEEQAQVPHHLVGLRLPHQSVSAGEYAKLVEGVIEDILQRKHQPILCGGAGLYYRALAYGIFAGSQTDLSVRAKLTREYEEDGGQKLLKQLSALDPEYARIVHANNKKRLIRALEIFETTGKPPTEHYKDQKSNVLRLNLFTVLVTMEINELENRIARRTDSMLAAGWVGEVERLKRRGNGSVHPSDSIGYKQIKRHLAGELSFEEMVNEINIKTRQYAKKQIAWFRKESIDLEIDLTLMRDINNSVEKVLDSFEA